MTPIPVEQFLATHGIATLIVAGIAFLVRWANARKSTKDWFVGWVVFALCVGGFFAVGTVYYIRHPDVYFLPMSLCGGCVGLISGNLIGHWVWKFYRNEIEHKDDLE
jgi:hypothetical protein